MVSLHMSVITQKEYSALMLAASEGKTEVVSLLLKAGAKVNDATYVATKLSCLVFWYVESLSYTHPHISCHQCLTKPDCSSHRMEALH